MAYEQRREAKQLYREVKALLGEEMLKSKLQRFQIWLKQRVGGRKLKEKDAEKGPDNGAGVQRMDSELSRTSSNVHSIQDKETQAISNTFLQAGPESQVELGTLTPPVKPATSSDADTNTPSAATNLPKKSRNEWIMIHSHYAIMGAYSHGLSSF